MKSQDIVQDGTLLNAYPMDVIRSITKITESKKVSQLVEVGELPEAREVASQPLQFRLELTSMYQAIANSHRTSCANKKLYGAALEGDKFAEKFMMRQGPLFEFPIRGKVEKVHNEIYEMGLSEKNPAAIYAKAITLLRSDDWDEENEGRLLLIDSADSGDGHAIAEVIRLNLIEKDHELAISWAKKMETSEDTEALVNAAVELIGWRKLEQGISLLRVACERNNSDALTLLGEVAHVSGDDAHARYLWKKASNSGNPHAMYYLAKGNVWEEFPMPISDPEVLGALHQSARLGSSYSHDALKENYETIDSNFEINSPECCTPEAWHEKYDCVILHEDHDNGEDFLRSYWFDDACKGNVIAQINMALALKWDFNAEAAEKIFDNLLQAGPETAAELIIRVRNLEYVETRRLLEKGLRLHPQIARIVPIRLYMRRNNIELPVQS